MTASKTVQVQRADGVTPAERYLKTLCDRSFLSFWSYAGLYRDQGREPNGGDGKEVCDLLVVFEDHLIIFSDKDCEFPNTGDVALDWSRWFRKAIQESAKQVWGAERWILSHPDRLFLDRSCTAPFPIDLPDPSAAQVHRVVVAHAASKRCKEELGGTGSLMIAPGIIGDMHYNTRRGRIQPFMVGQISPDKGFVHVFDDTTLGVVMGVLDTITDFVEYLARKEKFVTSGQLLGAAGEDDLLAYYLRDIDEDGNHDFIVPPGTNGILIDEGLWEDFANHPQRKEQLRANEISYTWDLLVERFIGHIFAGTSHYQSRSELREQEKVFRFLAREPRTRRRMLARSLSDSITDTPESTRRTRVILPSKHGDPHYVFLLLPHFSSVPYEEYRDVRRRLLEACCMVTKLKFPEAQDIVGIATETGQREIRSEDALYYDARSWTPDDQAEAQRLHEDLGLLTNVNMFAATEKEYPDLPASDSRAKQATMCRMKGRNRNDPCPCGSGMKYKKCCG